MKRAVFGLLTTVGLAGCYVAPGPGPYAGGPGPGPGPAYVAGPAYGAYYDDYYGPIYGGYWAGGVFYFRRGPDRPYERDVSGHFRRDAYRGFHSVRVEPGHDRDRGQDRR